MQSYENKIVRNFLFQSLSVATQYIKLQLSTGSAICLLIYVIFSEWSFYLKMI